MLQDNGMIIFGGFAFGERTNDIFRYSFIDNTWEKLQPTSGPRPCPRAGHSAAVRLNPAQGDCMFIFGGKDDDNNKLCDTWKFNFKTLTWTQIQISPEESPIARSGHAAQIYKDYMIIYGGIYEVTKELNDMHVFDLKNEKWLCLFEELMSPLKESANNSLSPGAIHATGKRFTSKNMSESPRKEGNKHSTKGLKSPSKLPQPPTTSSMKKRKHLMELSKLGAMQESDRVIKLESPTSITMKNCYLIKNADPSFEKSYQQIKKRAAEREKMGYNPSGYNENLTKTQGKRPPARDGHTGIIIGDSFFVFGGDRHHMPFNDFHMLDLQSEFAAKSFIFK